MASILHVHLYKSWLLPWILILATIVGIVRDSSSLSSKEENLLRRRLRERAWRAARMFPVLSMTSILTHMYCNLYCMSCFCAGAVSISVVSMAGAVGFHSWRTTRHVYVMFEWPVLSAFTLDTQPDMYMSCMSPKPLQWSLITYNIYLYCQPIMIFHSFVNYL